MQLKILSPERVVYDGQAASVVLPGTSGAFEVLPRHAALVSSLDVGRVTYVVDGREQSLDILSGFVEVESDTITVAVICDNS
ncbi:MAG: F0F1 ATP synthase subunit epsilon [Rikenellaceae bacterium]|jgi:F-type H+-transporting ATPase subunit epsilon|nr:F0F1 ATP synthase subunit epsilon [Rikenellaceae bacterium]